MIGKDVLSLLGILLVLLLVLGGCYLFTRWAGAAGLGGGLGRGSGRIQVLERLPVGRDQTLLVVRLADRYLVLSSSPRGCSLLLELTAEEGAQWTSGGGPAEKMDFRELVRKLRDKK